MIPFHGPEFFKDNGRMRAILSIPPARVQQWEANAVAVTATKKTYVPVDQVVAMQDHLDEEQKSQLLQVLKKYDKLFDGTLGCYPKRKFHIDQIEGSVPYHCKGPYAVPAINMPVLKQELHEQCEKDILA